ncbi:MAG: hypothetical protein AAGC82_09885 [Pseudomonadota bacterium]
MSVIPKHQGVRVWRQRGILAALTLIFAGSGALRLGEFDAAFAAGDDDMMDQEMFDISDSPNVASVEAALAAIAGRAEALDARETAIAERQSRLDAAEALIAERLAELEAAEVRLDALLATTDTAAASDVEQLITFYETMGPDDAAELFAEMDPTFAAGFLARMRPESGAGILAELSPDQAYAISIVLATRNADVPRSSEGTAP